MSEEGFDIYLNVTPYGLPYLFDSPLANASIIQIP